MDLNRVEPAVPLARIGRDRPLALSLASPGDTPWRQALEGFIARRFADTHGARVRHFLPCLAGLRDAGGAVRGAAGLRAAQADRLFLERYLERPVETALGERLGQPVPREAIVEVGNLAAEGSVSARLLIVALTDLLVGHGFRWVVFTGTPGLLNSFGRLGIELLPLGLADPAKMGAELADWGTYYASRPRVMAGDILRGHQRLLGTGAYPRLGYTPLYGDGGWPDVACG